MDLTTGLSTHLDRLSSDLRIEDPALETSLKASLAAFTSDLEAAVPSSLGLQLTIVERGHPVTLTAIATHRPVRTSLRLALVGVDPGFDPEGRIILYAGTPGAFVDLAADLGFALDLPTVLDDAVPPTTLVPGVSGLYELSTINRAIGILIGRGHHPDHAGDTLHRDAARQGLDAHHYAALLLGRPVELPRERPINRRKSGAVQPTRLSR